MQYFTGKEGKGWLVVVWGGLLLLLCFGFFLDSLEFQFSFFKGKRWIAKIFHTLDVTGCFGELLCLVESGRSRMPS